MPSTFNTLKWPLAKYSRISCNNIITLQLLSNIPGDLSIELHLNNPRLVIRHNKAVIEEISLQPLNNKMFGIRYKQIDVVFHEIHEGTRFRVKYCETGGFSARMNLLDFISQISHFVNVSDVESTATQIQNPASQTQSSTPLNESQINSLSQSQENPLSSQNLRLVPQLNFEKEFVVPKKKRKMNLTQETQTEFSCNEQKVESSTQTMTSLVEILDEEMLEKMMKHPNFINKLQNILDKNINK